MGVRNTLISLAVLILTVACQPKLLKRGPIYDYTGMSKDEIRLHKKVEFFLSEAARLEKPIRIFPGTRIDSLRMNPEKKEIRIYLNERFSFVPFREQNVRETYKTLRWLFGKKYQDFKITVYSLQVPIQELIPNFYRTKYFAPDSSRLPKKTVRPKPIVRPLVPWNAPKGLQGRNIVVWNSHGWYFNNKLGRWEWQRPRLFSTVEDLLPTSFVLPYLAPMLENAGARVFIPRERDIQTNEVVVDNDSPTADAIYEETSKDESHSWQTGSSEGFAVGNPPYGSGVNPFKLGTFRQTVGDSVSSAQIRWTPRIPESGDYAVYVSYHADSNAVDDALYTVFHAGGKSEFLVNQTIGGGTWIYLGTFTFRKGLHPDSGSVLLQNVTHQPGKIITADAVRFGGGMGNVARENSVSGRPRFEEGARYYLQYAGFPDTLVYNLHADSNDYRDDYQSRAEYANYLYGRPFGPNRNRQVKGLGIPIDLSLAFHTDAGSTEKDSVIGTLSIYSLADAETLRVFPDGVSRFANRDFADILQSQIVSDLQREVDSTWNRRGLREAQYSESFRPNVPAALLELLSHQNFRDMQMGLDPRFRFIVARSIYKAMLKFINHRYGQPFVVQPLPVTHFQALLDSAGRAILRWQPQNDPLEPSARPEAYIVYTRVDSGGFNEGMLVKEPYAIIDSLEIGKIYSFKVCAVNEGGKSFPSEILSVCRLDDHRPPVLIVNGFDRICGPTYFKADSLGGFLAWKDNGVPDRYDLGFVGMQFDLNMRSAYRSNDAPGFGASFTDYETRVVPGNTFDFAYIHGEAIKAAGYSFVSCSDEALMDGQVDLAPYKVMDLILGEERRTPWPFKNSELFPDTAFSAFPLKLQRAIKQFLSKGKALFVSGAYVGTDLFNNPHHPKRDRIFAKKWLRFDWVADHAARRGWVQKALRDTAFNLLPFRFNTQYNAKIYTVESPDALNPMSDSWTFLRYAENRFSAGVAHSGVFKTVVLGFPFETIIGQKQRARLMAEVLKFFQKK